MQYVAKFLFFQKTGNGNPKFSFNPKI